MIVNIIYWFRVDHGIMELHCPGLPVQSSWATIFDLMPYDFLADCCTHGRSKLVVGSQGALFSYFIFAPLTRRAFPSTDTELSAIAKPAKIGVSRPRAAIGIPMTL